MVSTNKITVARASTKISNQKRRLPRYSSLKKNIPVPPVSLQANLAEICYCDANLKNPCGEGSGCLNRAMRIECNRKNCPAGIRCQNQSFQRRISPHMEPVYLKERGFGLITSESIKKDSFIIEFVGEIINGEELERRKAKISKKNGEKNLYFLWLKSDLIIDAGGKGNLSRFMNHSCQPNCKAEKWMVNGKTCVGFFAIEDIPENTELTFDYQWEYSEGNGKVCLCGAPNCCGRIGKIKQK